MGVAKELGERMTDEELQEMIDEDDHPLLRSARRCIRPRSRSGAEDAYRGRSNYAWTDGRTLRPPFESEQVRGEVSRDVPPFAAFLALDRALLLNLTRILHSCDEGGKK